MSSLSFFPTGNTIINHALRKLRAIDPENAQTPSNTQISNALESLNFIVARWQAVGVPIWCKKQASFSPTTGAVSYTVGTSRNISIPRPLSIYQMWYRVTNGSQDIPITQISENDYFLMSVKNTQSTPNSYYYEPSYEPTTNVGTNSFGTLYLWPTADATFVANNVIYFRYQRPLKDFDSTADDLDFPQEYFDAILYELIVTLAPEYGCPMMEFDRHKAMSKKLTDEALAFDREQVSVYLSPANEHNQS